MLKRQLSRCGVGCGLLACLFLPCLFSGCASLEYYEKGRLQSDLMRFDEDPSEINMQQKTIYSREGGVGGIGASAGGGCGCY